MEKSNDFFFWIRIVYFNYCDDGIVTEMSHTPCPLERAIIMGHNVVANNERYITLGNTLFIALSLSFFNV